MPFRLDSCATRETAFRRVLSRLKAILLQMKSKTKKILLTRELHEVFIVRQSRRFRSFCDGCQSEAEFLTLDAAVHLSGLATREILRRVERLDLHAREAPSGHLLVCLNSLAKKQ